MVEHLDVSLFVFMLATFLGLEIIRRVSPLLHTPLMSLTNAISAISLVGSIVIENVFVLPGLGRLLFQSVGNRDLVIVQDIVMLLTASVLSVNFFVDVSYRLLDPRIRNAR